MNKNMNKGFFIKKRQTKPAENREKSKIPEKNEGHPENSSQIIKKEKAPFDKKKWREKKYSNKYKLEQWENKRKKKILHEYYKVKDESLGFDVQKIYEEYDNDDDEIKVKEDIQKNKPEEEEKRLQVVPEKKEVAHKKPRLRAIEEFNRIKQDKINKREEIARKKAEKEEALKVYKQKKLEKYKKLNKKTKKGQPIMKHRLEMLLEKIQKTCQESD